MGSIEGKVSIQRAEIGDTENLTEICRRAFDSDIDYGSPGEGGPPGYDSVEWNVSMIRSRFEDYYKIHYNESIIVVSLLGKGDRVIESVNESL